MGGIDLCYRQFLFPGKLTPSARAGAQAPVLPWGRKPKYHSGPSPTKGTEHRFAATPSCGQAQVTFPSWGHPSPLPLCVHIPRPPPFPLGRPQSGQVTLACSTNSLCHRLLICEMVQELPAYLLAGCREGWTSSRELGPRCSPLSPGLCLSHLPWGRH